ncbi:class I SAM-dependent methyltransferase [Anabaena sp. CA = ATCC 33047]|uniref:class I SAM-dependent methyltransferase n=1 Tax=Anabaena sp. (strain CA / ATCC 33047) TaxID=52271 RepID=UPI0008319760|nr:class I SAM-dependent methyltransferase [Anabaena sp. CA = ATCC 33047]
MGFYSQKILPYLLDWSLSNPNLAKYRQEILAQVKGEVLEIGFGTGVNLSYYPKELQKLITVDINPGVAKLAEKRIQASSIIVDYRVLNGESLPMKDNTFDSVVSTFTLCSIAQVAAALKEIYRVLKPGGKFFFIEHGLSKDSQIQAWQNRLTPIQKVIGDGCHLNRNIRQLVEQQFDHVIIEEMYADSLPKIVGYLYKGVATKAT